jgi:hypothetical protein
VNQARPFFIYDLETFYNCFLFCGKFVGQEQIYQFEMSPRINQRDQILQMLSYLQNCGAFMVGYNVLQFDYPIIHKLMHEPYTFDYRTGYLEGQKIIKASGFQRGLSGVRLSERLIPQIDLLKIHHFDNPNKSTSLKALQFAMRLESVEDMPVAFDRDLTYEEMDRGRLYNVHDVVATEQFFFKSEPAIKMRQELLDHGVLSGDVLNYSDVKIGTEYLVRKVGRTKCYLQGSKPRQTFRDRIEFREIILPKVQFRTEPFQAVLDWFNKQTVWINKDEVRPNLSAALAGLQFYFGVGGVHASVEKKVFHSTATHVVKDVDVSGMYVAVAIANGFAPEHLGQDFVTAYRALYKDRSQYAKGSSMNKVLKLAGNGASGNFENGYSPFYDPKCAYSIRINGQLLILMLAEMFALIPGVQLIQANTDGITALVPREVEHFFTLWCNEWECVTGLNLEYADYKSMFIRDVNNYIAVDMKGKIKRKGAYWYPITEDDYHGSSGSNWNKDFSNLSAQKGVEQVLLTGCRPCDIVRCITDPFDFMLRYKVRGGDKLFIGEEEQLRTVRYYVSTAGKPMKKVMPPKGLVGEYKRKNGITDSFYKEVKSSLAPGTWDERIHTKNKSRNVIREQAVENGRLVKNCNKASDFNWADVDWQYYEKEIEKLVI